MRTPRGFTLIEVAVTVAIIGIVAALAFPIVRASRRNASVQSTAFELGLWLDGLKAVAMRDQRDVVAVVMDVPDNDASDCARGVDPKCGGYYTLRASGPFALNGFDPEALASTVAYVDGRRLPRGIRFHPGAAGRAAARPYDAVDLFDPGLVGACGADGDRACVAVRFRGSGEVEPVWPDGVPGTQRPGAAFAIGTDLTGTTGGTDQRGVVVTFPTGLVKAFPVAP